MHIGKQSLEENEDGSRVCAFPTSVSAVKHEEWEMREIPSHIGLRTDTQQGCSAVGKEITEFYCAMEYWDADDFNDIKLEAFLKVRPYGVAFNEKAKVCAFLEFTRPMDSRDGAQDKDLEKNTRYARHLEYTRWASRKKGQTWTTAQYIYRGSERLRNRGSLGGPTLETKGKQRKNSRCLHALADNISNTTTKRFNLYRKFTVQMSGLL